jgi:hypothetical protein
MPELSWYTIEEGAQWHRVNGILEWIYHTKPAHPFCEDTPFSRTAIINSWKLEHPSRALYFLFSIGQKL